MANSASGTAIRPEITNAATSETLAMRETAARSPEPKALEIRIALPDPSTFRHKIPMNNKLLASPTAAIVAVPSVPTITWFTNPRAT